MRRCSEFRQLHKELTTDIPFIKFPDMPPKKTGAADVEKRTAILQEFLCELARQNLCGGSNNKVKRFLASHNLVRSYLRPVKSRQQAPTTEALSKEKDYSFRMQNSLKADSLDTGIPSHSRAAALIMEGDKNDVINEKQSATPLLEKSAKTPATTEEEERNNSSLESFKNMTVTASTTIMKEDVGEVIAGKNFASTSATEVAKEAKFDGSISIENYQEVIDRATEAKKIEGDMRDNMSFTIRIKDIKLQSNKLVTSNPIALTISIVLRNSGELRLGERRRDHQNY